MSKLAAFPQVFMLQLCKDGSMKIADWVKLAAPFHLDELEGYAGFPEMENEKNWPKFRQMVEKEGVVIPMMCCSPDFTHRDKACREKEIQKQKRWIDMTDELGGNTADSYLDNTAPNSR